MQCSRCRHENPADAVFCQECGSRLEAACPSCGVPNQLGAKFCKSCGQRLSQREAAPAAPEPRFGAPESYTPKHLAEKILTSKSALEGERKQVTVLFADLKGSMELLADRDPEEARKLLDPVLERMIEAVHRYEGTVNQVMGDGIMALFGAPVAHEDHAVRACYAALDMQGAIRRYAEEVRRTFGIRTEIRVGLHSGEVVVRAIGSDLRMDYTAVGQTTHLAARMEQLASAGTTLLTADTLRLAEGFVAVKPIGPVPVKGLEAPVEVYEMVGAGPRRSRLHAAATRGLTRFVGRESELEHLRHALARAAGGHGQVLAIVGEPGVGKSRLVWEVTHSHRTHGWLILQSGSVSYGKAMPYLPVIDLLKGYLEIEDRDDHRKISEKVVGKLLTLDDNLRPMLPALLGLLDVPVEDPQWQALDPAQRRQRTLDAVKRLLLRESQRQPLLVVLEDLHWMDGETQALLDSLVESLAMARMLLLVNFRPEYAHRWGGKTYYTQIRLDALPPESAETLLDALLGDDATLRSLKALLVERTEGNPLFLEESVRSLVDDGALLGDRGAYRLVKTPDTIHVPATVQAILAARIDRLPPEDKALLQAASVVGTDVPVAVLATVAEVSADALADGLAKLQAAEFLYETSVFPDAAYTFKHALTHEVAYASLLGDRRRALHGVIVESIERLAPGRLPEHVERLAHHALRAEQWDRAVHYLQEAARRAAARAAHQEATDGLEQALAALAHLPDDRTSRAQAVDLRVELARVLVPPAAYGRCLEHLAEAEKLAEALGDRARLGAALVQRALVLRITGETDAAIAVGRRALTLAGDAGDRDLLGRASFVLGTAYLNRGEFRETAACCRQAFMPLEGQLTPEGARALPMYAGVARAWLAMALAYLGEFPEAVAWAEEAIRIEKARDRLISEITARHALGTVHLIRGDLVQAISLLEGTLAMCRAHDVRDWLGGAAMNLGTAYMLAERANEARPLLEDALRHGAAIGQMSGQPTRLARLAECYLHTGRRAEAEPLARQGLALARKQPNFLGEVFSIRVLGMIAATARPPDAESARAALEQARDLAAARGGRPFVAQCHLDLGELHQRIGEAAKAEEHLTAAATMFREMGMTFWLEKVEAELSRLHGSSP